MLVATPPARPRVSLIISSSSVSSSMDQTSALGSRQRWPGLLRRAEAPAPANDRPRRDAKVARPRAAAAAAAVVVVVVLVEYDGAGAGNEDDAGDANPPMMGLRERNPAKLCRGMALSRLPGLRVRNGGGDAGGEEGEEEKKRT